MLFEPRPEGSEGTKVGVRLGLVHWKRASSPVEAGTQGTSDFRLRSQGPCRLGTGESYAVNVFNVTKQRNKNALQQFY